MKLLRAFLVALVLLLPTTQVATAHEISNVAVSCQDETVTATGVKFGETLPILVTLSGPSEYSHSYQVTTAEWSHAFPLGPNGSYTLSWPNSGQFTKTFSVDCPEATPTPTPRPTPTASGSHPTPTPAPTRHVPHVTPPATDSQTTSAKANDYTLPGALALGIVAIWGLYMIYWSTRRDDS